MDDTEMEEEGEEENHEPNTNNHDVENKKEIRTEENKKILPHPPSAQCDEEDQEELHQHPDPLREEEDQEDL